MQLVGLAFSGGGIRSATFDLGVLQALARLKLLGKFDYLSTVSGGGYIGSWLMAWMHRRGVKDVWAQLRPERARQAGGGEVSEIHFLRRFSNYLTPKLGWLGADMWTVIAVYLRNLILNLVILSSAFAFVLVLPRVVAVAVKLYGQLLWLFGRFLERHGLPLGPHELDRIAFAVSGRRSIGRACICRMGNRHEHALFRRRSGTERRTREVIENLETRSGWHDEDGNEIENPFAAPSGFFCYNRFFQDFILSLRFRFAGDGVATIFVWGSRQTGKIKD